jgi:superfamily I DNA/RNA helicase
MCDPSSICGVRYLTKADKLYDNGIYSLSDVRVATRQWCELKLSTSYRVTANMATFVNAVLLRRQHMTAHKAAGDLVFYLVGSPFKIAAAIGREIKSLIDSGKAEPSDFFVLAPSLKSQSKNATPVKQVENFLVECGIPVYVPTGDDDPIMADCSSGKVIFSSFHQCKGLERKKVFVFSFEKKYFDYFGKDQPKDICPCALYVAATRATETVCFVAEAFEGDCLPFIDARRLHELASEPSHPAVQILSEPIHKGIQ